MTELPKIVTTADGSKTLLDAATGEHYHSLFGATTESQHIFISGGLKPLMSMHNQINILEIGFGTGLNALLSFHSCDGPISLYYEAVDCCPLDPELVMELNYARFLGIAGAELTFKKIQVAPWGEIVAISECFTLFKRMAWIEDFIPEPDYYHLIYFDAFSPAVQPNLWSVEVFNRMYASMKHFGVLVTYSSRGVVKQALRQAGFVVERLTGPPGKRHMLRATKLSNLNNA